MKLIAQIKELFVGEPWQDRLLLIGLLWYFAFLSFTDLLQLPWFSNKIQLPELSFLLMICCLPFCHRFLRYIRFTFLDGVVLLHLFGVLLSIVYYPTMQVLKESLGTFYLVSCYFFFSRVFYHFRYKLMKVLQTGFALSIYTACLIALIAMFLMLVGQDTTLFYPYNNYPYWGDVNRLKGFASSPNLLFSTLSLATVFLFCLDQKKYRVLAFISFLVCLLTLSKGLALLVLFLLFMLWHKGQTITSFRPQYLLFFLLSVGCYIALTWFTIRSDRDKLAINQQLNTEQISQTPFKGIGHFSFHYTTHFSLQCASWVIINKYGWKGCGFGNYKASIEELKEEGRYPSAFASYDPHDFYMAQMAELGGMAVAFLLLLPLALLHTFRGFSSLDPNLSRACLLGLLFMVAESTCIGSLHFRHYWIFLAILNGLYLIERNKIADS